MNSRQAGWQYEEAMRKKAQLIKEQAASLVELAEQRRQAAETAAGEKKVDDLTDKVNKQVGPPTDKDEPVKKVKL